jgi:peptidoglycan/LPS O-acetylase OafA/YrhL
MLAQSVLNLSLYLLCVLLGYWFSGKITPPKTNQAWLLWIILVVFAGGVCVSGYAVNINDAVFLRTNDMLQAIGIGILIGFVIAKSRQVKPTTL